MENKISVALEKETTTVVSTARSLIVADSAGNEKASDLLGIVRRLQKEVRSAFNPIIEAAHKTHKEAIGQKDRYYKPLLNAEGMLKAKISLFWKQEKDKADRVQRELEKKAKNGETAPIVAPSTPKAQGQVIRDNWKALVTDKMLLIKAILDNKAELSMVDANMSVLNGIARATKAESKIPGVKFINEPSVTTRI